MFSLKSQSMFIAIFCLFIQNSIVLTKLYSDKNDLNQLLVDLKNLDIDQAKLEILERNQTSNQHLMGQCSIEDVLNKFLEIITPDDFDQANMNDMYTRVKNFNQTIEKFVRLEKWSTNIRARLEPTAKRIMSRVIENVIVLDLNEECLKSLVRIGNGISNQEKWAIQCELVKDFQLKSKFHHVSYKILIVSKCPCSV